MFFTLNGIAAAAAIQELYELDRRGSRDMLRGLICLAVLVGCSILAGWAGPGLRSAWNHLPGDAGRGTRTRPSAARITLPG